MCVLLRETERKRPPDFINSRAKGRVSTNSQLGGIFVEQRRNSLMMKGTSKQRALWATSNTYPPGFSRLRT